MNYRQLTKEEIARLLSRGCAAENWNTVTVGKALILPQYNTRFYGKVKLGRLSGKIRIEEGC
jgi:hypothetical protein